MDMEIRGSTGGVLIKVMEERISHYVNHLWHSPGSGIMWKCQIGYRLKSMPFTIHIPFHGMMSSDQILL